MKCTKTIIDGCFLIDVEAHEDERGMFGYTWSNGEAEQKGLVTQFDYTCISTNVKQGTLRGMHFQKEPYAETKLVRCTRGSMYDVVLDLRPASTTCTQWIAQELTAENYRAFYIPAGCAHGFITLEDHTDVLYHIAGEYNKEASLGVRFDDPSFAIQWPIKPIVISEKDRGFPAFQFSV